MYKLGDEHRKCDAETKFLYGNYAYSVQKSIIPQKKNWLSHNLGVIRHIRISSLTSPV